MIHNIIRKSHYIKRIIAIGLVAIAVVVTFASSPVAHAQFPGVNGRLFFSAISNSIGTGVFSSKLDYTNVHQYAQGFVNTGVNNAPVASPDGSKVAFLTASSAGQVDITVTNVDGTNPVVITNDTATEAYLGWSPDGLQLVYNQKLAASIIWQVVTKLADGTGSELIRTNNGSSSSGNSWSPDGLRIYFYRTSGLFSYVDASELTTAASELSLGDVTVVGAREYFDITPDGDNFLFLDSTSMAIRKAPIAGGVPTLILTLPTSCNYTSKPYNSPDGTMFLIPCGIATSQSGGMRIYNSTTGALVSFSNFPSSLYPDGASVYHVSWSTSQATLTENTGDQDFDGSTPGVPNTAANQTNRNNYIPFILGMLAIMTLLGVAGYWLKLELRGKK